MSRFGKTVLCHLIAVCCVLTPALSAQISAKPAALAVLTDTHKLQLVGSFQAPKGKNGRHGLNEFKYVENRRRSATCVYGTIHGSVAWAKSKSPYVMTESVFVAEDGELRIEPGVTVKIVRPEDTRIYDAGLYSLSVFGRLSATGRPGAMIRFIPMSAKPEQASEWGGIGLNGPFPNVLRWARIEYAGFGVESNSGALIAHCVFANCHTGIYLDEQFRGDVVHNVSAYNIYSGVRCRGTGSNATIRDNIFYSNGDGIDAWGDAVAYADYNLYFADVVACGCGGSGCGCGPRTAPAYQGMEPGKHDLTIEPRFLNAKTGDFRLAKNSSARLAGYMKLDVGLGAEQWSEASDKAELDTWMAGGARSLWLEAMPRYGCSCGRVQIGDTTRDAFDCYVQALKLNPPAELRSKILCSLGALMENRGKHAQAQYYLNKALAISPLPHLRDAARRQLAESKANGGNPKEAMALVDQCECAQSKVWTEPAVANYSAAMGDADSALQHIAKYKEKEPDKYVQTLSGMIRYLGQRDDMDTSLKLLVGFKDYPICEEGSRTRTELARNLRSHKRYEEAARLLRESLDLDPYNEQATESLAMLADIYQKDLGRTADAEIVRQELVKNYFPMDKAVASALAALGGAAPAPPRNQCALLDESLGESSIYDRGLDGSNNFGQYEVLRALLDAGFETQSTGRSCRELPPLDVLSKYGLVVMNGRYGESDNPPIPDEAVENLVTYVKDGGSLLVVSGGNVLGEGKGPQFFNKLVSRFGLRFREGVTLPYDNNRRGRLSDHPSVAGLKGFWAEHGVPVDADPKQILGYCGKEPVIALAEYGAGRVVAAGMGSGFMGQCMGKDDGENAMMNKALVVRLASYLLDPTSTPLKREVGESK